jgi:homopolymeric O-antigen transport system ATP-binding protein
MNSVIQVEHLGKEYRRGLRVDTGLRHALERFLRSPLSVFRGNGVETFWALRDVSLQVHQGEVLGLIGRNGAGKTTLLKILSRITRPTEGWAEIRGHVGSLLEVGTGFHPELTGRENTFLSGAILGMSRREIARKFDEIVAFAELEKFIDTPVKHYSSGMYVRLAFAVAAHLEPEILIVDEVLAVGDINFQKKCLGKMGEVAKGGRTVVLVSHQLNQIRRLCQRVVWVDAGGIRQAGPTYEVVSAYESAMARGETTRDGSNSRLSTKARFLRWEICGANEARHTLHSLGPVTFKFVAEISEPIHCGHHGIALYNHDRQLIWGQAAGNLEIPPGTAEFRCTLPSLPVRPGPYAWVVTLWEQGDLLDWWDCVPEMNVALEPLTHQFDEWAGLLNIPMQFSVVQHMEQNK